MSPDGSNDLQVQAAAERPDRPRLLAFTVSRETETALREGLAEAVPQGFEIRRGNVRAAMAALQKMPSPHMLIVDLSGEKQPLSALGELSEVVEPDVRVLVVGDRDDLNFYRQVTRGLGVMEYLYQPLMRDMVARYFGPLVIPGAPMAEAVHGGRVVTVTGARGGTGASTIAANLAWHFGVEARRHTVLLDADLHRGTAAMLLGANTGPGLRTALEAPDRIDELFVERAAQPVGKRVHVLAGEEKLTEPVNYAPDAAARLIAALRQRYNFVVIDVPCSPLPLHHDLLMLAHQRVLVMDPTLASVRDTLRLLALPNGPMQPRRGVLVLNRDGMPGGLNRRQLEEGLKMKPDVMHSRPAQGGRPRRQHGRTGGGGARRFPHRNAAPGAGGRVRPPARQRHRVRTAKPAASAGSAACSVDVMNAAVARLRPLPSRRPDRSTASTPRHPHAPALRSGPCRVIRHAAAHRTGPDPEPAHFDAASCGSACLAQLDPASIANMPPDRLALEVERVLSEIATAQHFQLNAREQRQLAGELVDDMLGLGPLEPLLEDDSITDIMVNGPNRVFVERGGKVDIVGHPVPRCRRTSPTSRQRIASAIGRRIDESSPMVDARLKDGSRVNIVFPPLALDGPYISIRKFARQQDRFRQAGRLRLADRAGRARAGNRAAGAG